MNEKKVAIIGGGASATLLLAHLAKRERAESLKVDIYDRNGRFGRGVAYSTTRPEHLLNVRAGNMSAYAEDDKHFLRWLDGRYGTLDFVPRMVFGDYLEDQLKEAGKVCSLRFIEEDVKNCTPGKIETATGNKNYDHVILATGNCVPLACHTAGDVAGYHDCPWNIDYTALSKQQDVTIIGSGLSAVDMVMSLNALKFAGTVRVVSRNGLFPGVHIDPASYNPFLKQMPLSALEGLHWVRREVRKAAAQSLPWQPVIDSLRIYTNEIWQGWDEAQREIFLSRLFTFWNSHRHRRAPQTEEVLRRLKERGQLIVVKTRAREIRKGPVIVTDQGEIPTDAAINCLGYRYHEQGRSFAPSAAIGPARFGPLLETTAIPEIRAQARDLAAKILI